MAAEPTTEDRTPAPEPEARHGVTFPAKLTLLRHKLNLKAKQEPKFRFYALRDRIYRLDVLHTAYALVRANRGAAGIDGVTFKSLEGREQDLILGLQEELRTGTYKPQPVRRVYIPKPDGRMRPLGIPTIKDRVAQMAALLILEPIFEADFLDCSHGFRPGRSAHDALDQIRDAVRAGLQEVYDADLASYFDTIPHDQLMAAIEKRIVDRKVLKLIRLWLAAPIVDDSGDDGPKVSRPKQGTPQGGVLSPLLANVYLHWFDRLFHSPQRPGPPGSARLVRYADDFVVLANRLTGELTSWIGTVLESRFKLRLNQEKTQCIDLKEQGASLDFLGFTFRFDRDLHGRGHRYLHCEPSRRSQQRARSRVRSVLRGAFSRPVPEAIGTLNMYLRGWGQYFQWGYPLRCFHLLDQFARHAVYCHVTRRSQRPMRPPRGRSWYDFMVHDLKLHQLTLVHQLSAKANR